MSSFRSVLESISLIMSAISLLVIRYSKNKIPISFVNNNLDRRINYAFLGAENATSENLSADINCLFVVNIDNPSYVGTQGIKYLI